MPPPLDGSDKRGGTPFSFVAAMNDNHPERPDDRTADEWDRHVAEATTATILAAAKVAEIHESDPETALSLMRNIAKRTVGAMEATRKAKELRS